jgi:hypothetical protein
MISPHGWITLAVPGPDGRTTQWIIETSNPNGLMRLGWSKRSLKFGSSATRLREAFPRERRIEHRERRDGDAGGRAQGLRRLLRHALRNAMNGRRSPIAGRCATAAFFALLSARASVPLHAPAALPRLAECHPDLQGLWMRAPADSRGCSSDRSTGRTSPPVARGGRGGGRSPAAPEYPYSGGGAGRPPETRLRRSRGALPSSGSSSRARSTWWSVSGADHSGRQASVSLLHEAMHHVRIIPTHNSPHPRNCWAWDWYRRLPDGSVSVHIVDTYGGRADLPAAPLIRADGI